jgi:hypothetical protein
MDFSEIKINLYNQCLEWLDHKIQIATKAMKDAQDSANSEEKSSAGDKFETGRAMSHNERDMYAKQLAECNKQKQLLLNTDLSGTTDRILPGSLVITDVAQYFILISAGNIKVEEKNYFVVSPETPIAQLILNKKAGDGFMFNGKEIKIKNIY